MRVRVAKRIVLYTWLTCVAYAWRSRMRSVWTAATYGTALSTQYTVMQVLYRYGTGRLTAMLAVLFLPLPHQVRRMIAEEELDSSHKLEALEDIKGFQRQDFEGLFRWGS